MRFGSLFSGIGGLDLGLERAGMTCKWQVEIDDYCTCVLEKHWPDVEKFRDIKKIKTLSDVDLICGGFPCQPVSLAGKRRWKNDERWLWDEFFRIICLVRPKYIIVENVPGLLSRGMSDVLADLASSRYDAEWQSIPAFSLGAPHRRDRVFIIAYPNREPDNQHVEIGRIFTGRKRPSRKWDENWLELIMESGAMAPTKWKSKKLKIDPRPLLIRNNDGIPSGMDRLRGLGNAVVPQVAQWIGERILEFDSKT